MSKVDFMVGTGNSYPKNKKIIRLTDEYMEKITKELNKQNSAEQQLIAASTATSCVVECLVCLLEPLPMERKAILALADNIKSHIIDVMIEAEDQHD